MEFIHYRRNMLANSFEDAEDKIKLLSILDQYFSLLEKRTNISHSLRNLEKELSDMGFIDKEKKNFQFSYYIKYHKNIKEELEKLKFKK